MLQISKESMHGVEAEFMLIVKGSFYISNPPHCENREVGGISPPWLKSFKNGGISPPCPYMASVNG